MTASHAAVPSPDRTLSAFRENMPVTLQCSFKVVSGKTLNIETRIVNTGPLDVYVFDRLWDLDQSNHPMADPEKMYRFIRNSELRLLLGPAPLPRLKSAAYKNIPYATLIKARSTLDLKTSFDAPIKEYSVYFPEGPNTKFTPVTINRVVLLLDLVEARAEFQTTPCPFDPSAVKIEVPGVLDSSKRLSCQSTSLVSPGLLRSDEFDRLTLPGEEAEPLKIPH